MRVKVVVYKLTNIHAGLVKVFHLVHRIWIGIRLVNVLKNV